MKKHITYTLFLLVSCFLQAQVHFAPDDGLPAEYIEYIAADSMGFVWVATKSGLAKYEGERFNLKKFERDDSGIVSKSRIYSLFLSSNGKFYTGTDGYGLYTYDYQLDIFRPYANFNENPAHPERNIVKHIAEDNDGNIWVSSPYSIGSISPDGKQEWYNIACPDGTEAYINIIYAHSGAIYAGTRDHGAYIYKPGFKSFVPLYANELSNESVTSFAHSSAGSLYIGTQKSGLYIYRMGQLAKSVSRRNSSQPLWTDEIYFSKNIAGHGVCIGTINGGAFIFNDSSMAAEQIMLPVEHGDKFTVSSVFNDNSGEFWLGTHSYGVFVISPPNSFVRKYSRTDGNETIAGNVVSSLAISDNYLWVGTDGNGLSCFEINTGRWLSTSKLPKTQTKVILDIITSADSLLYLATWGQGISRLDIKGNNEIMYGSSVEGSLLHDNVKGIYLDRNILYAATHGSGIEVLEIPKGGKAEHKTWLSGKNLSLALWGNQILKDMHGDIWAATTTGLFRYSRDTVQEYLYSGEYAYSIPSNYISCLVEDSDSILWIGTSGGLCFYDRARDIFIKSSCKYHKGFIKSITRDETGGLWVASEAGISYINGETSLNINSADHPMLKDFTERSMVYHKKRLFVGTSSGLLDINVSGISEAGNHKIFMTNFRISNTIISPRDSSFLTSQLQLTDSITISYKQNIVTFEFMHNLPNRDKHLFFRHRLLGLDSAWQDLGYRNAATYTSLAAGTYIFQVQIVDVLGRVMGASRTLTLIVTPPWWKTIWFRIIAVSFLIFAVAAIFYLRLRSIKAINKQLEETVKTRTSGLIAALDKLNKEQQIVLEQYEEIQKNKEILQKANDELRETIKTKDTLVSMIGHDIKNPVGAISGLLSLMPRLIAKNDIDKLNTYVSTLIPTVKNLEEMLCNLLDWSLGRSGKISFTPENLEIQSLISDNLTLLKLLADKKSITMQLTGALQSYALADKRMIDAVIRNLLQNSIKFTENNGKIKVCISESEKWLEISIKDTGVGMTQEQISQLLDKGVLKSTYGTDSEKGTGLGLQMCMDFIAKNSGRFEIYSNKNEGTEMLVKLPKSSYADKATEDSCNCQTIFPESFDEDTPLQNDKPVLLAIDDNKSILEFVSQELKYDYNIALAYNGQQGLDKASELIPDIIVSDINMPGIDGKELCRFLKADILTHHIPIIFLTGKNSKTEQIASFEAGVDDFIAKPFDIQILKAKITSILVNRQRLKKHYSAEAGAYSGAKIEDPFLQKLNITITEYISEPQLNIEFIADKLGYSRSQIYRKCLAVAGVTPLEFIKNIKINLAKAKLENTSLNISEIAYELGYSDPQYFSLVFTKEVGLSPKKFRDSLRK
jgi:signal transduction histidine kinase/ligand-binding sensor domain-containing protein/AraC-like DNA-binding protein